jgi:hypothetical protein
MASALVRADLVEAAVQRQAAGQHTALRTMTGRGSATAWIPERSG